MSDTPKTDEAAFDIEINGEGGWDSIHWTTGNVMNVYTSAHFSRELERENADLHKRLRVAAAMAENILRRNVMETGSHDFSDMEKRPEFMGNSALPNVQAQR